MKLKSTNRLNRRKNNQHRHSTKCLRSLSVVLLLRHLLSLKSKSSSKSNVLLFALVAAQTHRSKATVSPASKSSKTVLSTISRSTLSLKKSKRTTIDKTSLKQMRRWRWCELKQSSMKSSYLTSRSSMLWPITQSCWTTMKDGRLQSLPSKSRQRSKN